MSAAGASQYNQLQVSKPRRGLVVDTKGKIIGFDYYESLFSPTVTATMVQYDTGGTVASEDSGLRGTLKDALPIEGFEEVGFEIATRYGTLDFMKKPMIITGTPSAIDEPQRQSILINMVSKYSLINSKKVRGRVYPQAPISDIVSKILSDPSGLNIPKSQQFIDKTINDDKVSCNHDSPLEVITGLCKKSIPYVEGLSDPAPGYFFFETKSGFHFKSIDKLIHDGRKQLKESEDYRGSHTYGYFPTGNKNVKNPEMNDFNVLNIPDVQRDQNILKSVRRGEYNVRICTLNTLTHQYDERIVNLLSGSNLGRKQETQKDRDFHKTYTYLLNPGADAKDVSLTVLNNPALYEPRAMMRYSLLQAQLVKITVPCNMELEAGDVIELNLGNITDDNKLIEVYNLHRSGAYLILHLCHHFDSDNSYTYLTLCRDTYGKRSSLK